MPPKRSFTNDLEESAEMVEGEVVVRDLVTQSLPQSRSAWVKICDTIVVTVCEDSRMRWVVFVGGVRS